MLKRVVLLGFAGILILAVAACGSSAASSNATSTGTTPSATLDAERAFMKEAPTTTTVPPVTTSTTPTSSTEPQSNSSTSSTHSQTMEQILEYREATRGCFELAGKAAADVQQAANQGYMTTSSVRGLLYQGLDEIAEVAQNLRLLTPPKEFEASHRLLLEALRQCITAADIIDDKPTLDERDQSDFKTKWEAATALVKEAKALQETEMQRVSEQ